MASVIHRISYSQSLLLIESIIYGIEISSIDKFFTSKGLSGFLTKHDDSIKIMLSKFFTLLNKTNLSTLTLAPTLNTSAH